MRILAVADAESRALERFEPSRWGRIDLIVSCGDLPPGYVDYLVTTLNVPCCYVRGNHDQAYRAYPLGGCEDLDGRVVRVGGLRIAGLEGSRWYGGSGVEVGDRMMEWKARLLSLRILLAGGIDVLVTHAPPRFDPSDPAPTDHVHLGFAAFNRLLARHRPQLHLHGHIHMGYGRGPRERRLADSRVVDCFGALVLEAEPRRKRANRPVDVGALSR